jgi:hypothetical protein
MRPWTKTIVREVILPKLDPAFEDSHWVIKVGPMGVLVRRYGAAKRTARLLPWRGLIGVALTSVRKGV